MFERQINKSIATVLRHYIELQAPTRSSGTEDNEGGRVVTWATYATVSAAVDPIRAVQQFENRSVGVDATHYIKIRGEITVDEKDRIKWGSRTFEILTIENINERGILKFITAKEVR